MAQRVRDGWWPLSSVPGVSGVAARLGSARWLRSRLDRRWVPVEEFVQDGRFVVRVELPGIDPGRDVELTVSDGALVIQANRGAPRVDDRRSEFRYGRFLRQVALPYEAKADSVNASYSAGILRVTVELDARDEQRLIPVEFSG